MVVFAYKIPASLFKICQEYFICGKQDIYMSKMGKINLEIDDKLEKEFRKAAAEKFEARKGFLKKAVEEAIRDWLRKNSKGARNV
jgi:hypothetical protein